MTDPVYSPDGKFMWTGTAWIPAPPTALQAADSSSKQVVNLQDSVIGGDVVHSTVINNDPEAVTSAVIAALQQMGMVNQAPSVPAALPPLAEVELPASFSVGDHVEYHSPTNARWLDRCKIVAINDDGTYRIEVPKDARVEIKHAVVIGSSPGTIRPSSPPFNTGDRVFVDWKGYGHFYPGRIASEHDNHTFMIHFDDGDVEDNVEWGRIEPLQENSTEVQEYVENVMKEEQELIDAFQVFDLEGSGTISAGKYFEILTEMGDEPISVEDVLEEFAELGIAMDSEIDYRALAKYMVGSEAGEVSQHHKTEVIVRDAEIVDGVLKGYAYSHPRLGEGPVRTSSILAISFDERATARVETRNTMYVVGPTGWTTPPSDHPFNNPFSAGEQVKAEWKGEWWDSLIREVVGQKYLIHYVGFDSSWDEWVGPERIQKKPSPP
ncbi:MAG: hypothetical protein CMA63_01935 [Euryarchaeota archaeon]|nr:hypothetical protein [Euryarchaeota archaeon]|tara:strand:- start:21309 stop:22619 length:1311 start_codon:yes stop_codon:yes gene_type:complete